MSKFLKIEEIRPIDLLEIRANLYKEDLHILN